jgi:CBS domain-containing protein
MLVQQILKSKGDDGVVTVAPGTSVQKVAELLSTRRIGAVVVSPDGKEARGIVSERDIVREIVSCTRTESTDEVLGRMTDGRFRHMPVMEGDQMVGLISIGDVVKARLMELAAEKDALEGMIKGF